MAHNSFLPDVTYLKDPYIKEITKGKFRDFTYFTVGEHDQLYPFALGYIPEHLDLSDDETSTDDTSNLWSFRAQYLGGNQLGMFYDPMYGLQTPPQGEEIDESNIVEREKKTNRNFTGFTAGYGLFKLKHEDATIYVLHKSVGDPVGTMNGVAVHNLLVFFVKGRNNTKPLSSLMELIASLHQVERPPNDIIEVYRYNLEFMGWDRFYNARTRPEGSVILPHETKKKILDDVRDFIDKDTKRWYYEKGIPYKRSYLFYGVPGSGKTSIISVLAGKYKRPICYISPTDPKMTDGILKKAVQDAPQRGILIFEDVDGLFSKDRKSNVQNYLTFSGLLNALDGVGSGLGQIFILTTNYRDRLDSALIRNGRVDLRVEFKHVNQEQAVEMFGLFYAEADEKARRDFATKVFELSKTISAEPCISAAMLQNFFITHRRCTYEEAIDRVEDLIEEVKNAIEDDARREVERKQKEEEEKKQKKDELSHNGGPLGVNADLLSMMNQIHQQSVQMNHSFEEEDLLEQ